MYRLRNARIKIVLCTGDRFENSIKVAKNAAVCKYDSKITNIDATDLETLK